MSQQGGATGTHQRKRQCARQALSARCNEHDKSARATDVHGQARQGTIATERLCCDKPLILLCRDIVDQ